MARRTRHGDRVTRRRAALLGGIALVLAGCRSAPNAVEPSPNRAELLARRIEAAFEHARGLGLGRDELVRVVDDLLAKSGEKR